MSNSLDKLTDRAREVLRIAVAFGRQSAHRDIEPQDLLDALAQTGGISDYVLEEMGYQRKRLPPMVPYAEQIVCGSESLRTIVAQAREQSVLLRHGHIGTEHLLLALAQIKPKLTPDYQRMRARISELLGPTT